MAILKDAATKQADADPITDEQVKTVMGLLGQGRHEQGCWYDGPTTLEGVQAMSKPSASTYITALLDA
ncbi:hypothetical protein [Nesterenkonia rhizosphaerae]|uniref:Uncharacterized protein n=1 Tax=Nesterenkonia rhizosphaerae TaxID=1348272 RepID=A0ABP9G0T2_9MICC